MATTFADLGSLATKIAEVVKLRAANISAANDFKLLDNRSVHGEGALYADAVRDLANRESFASARTRATNDDALEDLDTALGTFDNTHVNLEFIARAKCRDARTEGGGVNRVEYVHDRSLLRNEALGMISPEPA